jgi:hypothetical protein
MTVASAATLASLLHASRPRCLCIGTLLPVSATDVCSALAASIVATQEPSTGACTAAGGPGELLFLGQDALAVQRQCSSTLAAPSHAKLMQRRLEDWAALYGTMLTGTAL